MFWFSRNTFVGSYLFLSCASHTRAIERSKNGENTEPIPLDGDLYHQSWGYALRLVLTYSYMDRRGDVARMYDALAKRYIT